MIYSSWIPDKGGYAYYETQERLGLSDDLSVPRLRQTSPIGVASTSIGRPLPPGAKLVGQGPLARGSIVPLDRSGLSGSAGTTGQTALLFVLGTVSFIGSVFLMRHLKD